MTRLRPRLALLLRLLAHGPLDAARQALPFAAASSAFAHPVLRVLRRAYPVWVTFVIVATANHVLADAVLAALVAALSAFAARELARTRPAGRHLGREAATT